MIQPSSADVEAVKEYLRQRLAAERSMVSNLEKAMADAAGRIVAICYAANVSPAALRYDSLPRWARLQVDEIIRRLKETADDYFRTLAVAGHEDNEDEILPYVLGERYGQTFDERLDGYCDNYRDEVLLLVAAGLSLGLAESVVSRSIGGNLRHPYANPSLADGIDDPISYGRGRTSSMFTAIGDLTRFGIAQAWARNQYLENIRRGCVGWVVRRGSSYPCELCDSEVGFHADESDLPPYHLHCCCLAVPVYI